MRLTYRARQNARVPTAGRDCLALRCQRLHTRRPPSEGDQLCRPAGVVAGATARTPLLRAIAAAACARAERSAMRALLRA